MKLGGTIKCITDRGYAAARDDARERLTRVRAELKRFEATLIRIESPSDIAMLKRLRASEGRATADVAWCEAQMRRLKLA
jgi:hypothetical protein